MQWSDTIVFLPHQAHWEPVIPWPWPPSLSRKMPFLALCFLCKNWNRSKNHAISQGSLENNIENLNEFAVEPVIIEIPNGVTNKKRAQKNKQTKESHSHSSRYLGTVGIILKTAIKYIDSNFVKYKFWIFHTIFYTTKKTAYSKIYRKRLSY